MLCYDRNSVAMSCQTPCDPMNCSPPSFPVLHYLPEFAQTHVHWVSDAIQPSYPLSASSLAVNFSWHQGLFQWIGSSHLVTQDWSFSFIIHPAMTIQGWYPLGLTGLISLLSKELSRVFSSITVRKHQFFGTRPSLWSNSYIQMWLMEKT